MDTTDKNHLVLTELYCLYYALLRDFVYILSRRLCNPSPLREQSRQYTSHSVGRRGLPSTEFPTISLSSAPRTLL
jgi:hypothetical protein